MQNNGSKNSDLRDRHVAIGYGLFYVLLFCVVVLALSIVAASAIGVFWLYRMAIGV